ncbi:YihY/virulence factor BrkB family protein [Chitinasiproducens palmae]|uniref:Membrane protein n=1 Tax=Chitinasiproducens palmae TaxID=1770053 RepID=A0A1H2PQH5_9BURK|nr:YihY/virulence factor BrkB family protein [Chitinasiproducens palmae]SDV49050.1 membrane protein [Chitinasiproducens palmae]
MSTTHKHSVGDEAKREISVAKSAAKRFSSDNCTTMAAGIAFYSAFSLAPTLVMVLSVVGWFYGAEAARGQLFSRINGFLGNDAAAAIQSIVENAHKDGGGGIAAIVSLVLLIVGASATFSTLNTALNVIFPVPEKDRPSSIALLVRVRLTSFGLVLGIAFLLIASLVLDTVVSYIGEIMWAHTPWVVVGDIVQVLISLVVLALAFTALLKLLPDASIAWRDAMLGGIVSAILFSAGKKLFALYLSHAGTASAFGAAGSLAVLLMWLFFSAVVLLVGAEFVAAKMGFAHHKDPTSVPGKVAHPEDVARHAALAAGDTDVGAATSHAANAATAAAATAVAQVKDGAPRAAVKTTRGTYAAEQRAELATALSQRNASLGGRAGRIAINALFGRRATGLQLGVLVAHTLVQALAERQASKRKPQHGGIRGLTRRVGAPRSQSGHPIRSAIIASGIGMAAAALGTLADKRKNKPAVPHKRWLDRLDRVSRRQP